jgi:hypothetical protein
VGANNYEMIESSLNMVDLVETGHLYEFEKYYKKLNEIDIYIFMLKIYLKSIIYGKN